MKCSLITFNYNISCWFKKKKDNLLWLCTPYIWNSLKKTWLGRGIWFITARSLQQKRMHVHRWNHNLRFPSFLLPRRRAAPSCRALVASGKGAYSFRLQRKPPSLIIPCLRRDDGALRLVDTSPRMTQSHPTLFLGVRPVTVYAVYRSRAIDIFWLRRWLPFTRLRPSSAFVSLRFFA